MGREVLVIGTKFKSCRAGWLTFVLMVQVPCKHGYLEQFDIYSLFRKFVWTVELKCVFFLQMRVVCSSKTWVPTYSGVYQKTTI
jgi:hypothetical protein